MNNTTAVQRCRRLARLLVAVISALLASPQVRADYPSDILNIFGAEPEPFRGDELDPRDDFEYDDESFLHRYSYRLRTDWQQLWDREREGFVITAGSTRSDELLVLHQLRKTIPLDEIFFAVLRHQRSEDFDARYDRFLTGIGAKLGAGWSLALLGDVVAEKQEIDPQFELTWNDAAGNRFRWAFLMTDAFFDRKNDEGSRYQKQPYTYFVEGRWKLSKTLLISGWLNWNTELDLEYSNESRFTYDQFMHEATILWTPVADWQVLISAGSQNGERSLSSPGGINPEHFDRDHALATLEAQYQWSATLKSYHGYHYFFLKEQGRYRDILPLGGELRRSEQMLYSGVVVGLTERINLSPGIYFDLIDNDSPPSVSDSRPESVEKLLSKLIVPVEYAFSPRALMSFNTTAELHQQNFGGFNLQFLILF